ncbi:MAG: hypothetical protein ACPGO5_05295 [Patescibacteria group bacterium]
MLMTSYKQLKAYIKDNPEGYWFKRRPWGYGWIPATWHGWVVTIGIIVLVIANTFRFENASDEQVLKEMLPQTFVLIGILIAIAWKKGETPKWQWGIPKKKDDE